MKIFQILSNIDRRVIYLLLSISVITPMIIKIEMPIAPDQYAQTAYNAISEKFEEYPSSDRKILLSFDFGPSTEPELGPMAFSIMKQVLPLLIFCHLSICLIAVSTKVSVSGRGIKVSLLTSKVSDQNSFSPVKYATGHPKERSRNSSRKATI